MRNILFVCNLFSPANHISAIRPTKLAKYLSVKEDVKIYVVAQVDSTEQMNDKILMHDIEASAVDVIYIKKGYITGYFDLFVAWYVNKKTSHNKPAQVKEVSVEKKANTVTGNSLSKKVIFIIRRIIDHDRAGQTYRVIQELRTEFDAVITFGPNFSPLVGKRMKKKDKRIKWIADFRDPVYNETIPDLFKNSALNYCKRVVKTADRVIAVSPGYMEALHLPLHVHGEIITNGYDSDDLNGISPKMIDPSLFTLGCVGNLYAGKRSIVPILRCIKQLQEEKKLSYEKIRILYAGVSEDQIYRMTAEFQMEKCVVSFGKVPRDMSIAIQLSSDLLLLPSWNDYDGQGIVPGKFLEHMMMSRPIVALISGKGDNCYVADLIRKLNLGFAYENAYDDVLFPQLKAYLLKSYHQWEAFGYVTYHPDETLLSEYSYPVIANKFYEIICEGR